MFEVIKYRWKLQKLENECREIQRSYAEHRKGLSGEELKQLHAEEGSEVTPILDQISCLKSSRLHAIANRLIVPIPKMQDETYWETSYYTGGYFLTTEGMNEVRKRIRQERKERCELILIWIPSIVGILGGLIGLITVIKQ